MKPEFVRDGDGYVWLWRELGIGIGFDLLRETAEGLHGEIHVQSISDPLQPGHFHWAKHNLSSTRSRQELGRHLTKRNNEVDWDELLEIACTKTAILFREGERVEDLSVGEVETSVSYLVRQFLVAGQTNLVFAHGGSGKSLLALAIALSCRTGVPIAEGLEPRRPVNVLYLDWEADAITHRRRLERLCQGAGMAARPTVLYRRMTRAVADDIAHIRKEVDRHAVGLVIVDSLAYALAGEPEAAEPTLRALNAVGTLPATRLVLAHISGANARLKNGEAKPYGTVFSWNSARTVWELRGNPNCTNPVDIGLYQRKANDGEKADPIGLRFDFGARGGPIRVKRIAVDEDPELAEHATLGYRIRSILRRGARSAQDIADELEANESSVRTALRRMPDITRLPGSSLYGLSAN